MLMIDYLNFNSYQKKKLHSRQKKLKAYDLSSFSEFLPDFEDSQEPAPAIDFKLMYVFQCFDSKSSCKL